MRCTRSTVEGAQPSSTGLVVAPTTLTYHYAANGLDVVKTFKFDSSYVVGVEAEVKHNGVPVRALVEWPAGLGDMEEFLPSSSTRSTVRTSAASMFAWSLDGKQDSIAAKKLSGNATLVAALQLCGGDGSLFCGGVSARKSRRIRPSSRCTTRSMCPATSAIRPARRLPRT